MLKSTTTILAFAIAAGPSFAQELTYGSFGFDFTRLTDGSDDLDLSVLNGDVEFAFDQFLLGAQVTNRDFSSDSLIDGTITNFNAFGAYAIIPEVLVGVGLNTIDLDGSDLSGYEVFGQYQTAQFGVGLTYTIPDSDEDDVSFLTILGEAEVTPGVTIGAAYEDFSEIDESFYYLTAEYEDGPIFVRGYYTSVTDIDGYLIGARGSYDVTDMIHVSADLQKGVDFFLGDLTAYSVGAGYEFADGFIVDASVGRIEGDGNEIDTIQVGVSYELGQRRRLDRKMIDAVREDRARTIDAVVPSLGIGIGFGFGL